MTSSIIGIPTSRISNLYIQQQLLDQVQYCQSQLARAQVQLATGHQFEAPSENPVAAMRVVSLQRLLGRKDQMQSNLSANQSYLSTTDSTLMNVSSLLTQARAAVVGAVGSTTNDAQRQAAVQQVDQVLQQLVTIGNQQFRGRYLFGGSDSNAAPFQISGSGGVTYTGNQQRLASYADIHQLFDSNVTGSEAFGAISTAVQGARVLTPNLTLDTRLADLRQGQGINPGSIAIGVSSGNNTFSSTVDLSKAETIGDVAALIKANSPKGMPLDVEVTAKGLVVGIAFPGTGNISIQEVGGGVTADQLGILCVAGSSGPITGRTLDPILRSTTSLDEILGARATAVVHSGGTDNDFIVRADVPGETNPAGGQPFNQMLISFQNDGAAGNETVDYDGTSIVVHIDSGHSTAAGVVKAINAKHDLGEIPFTAELDPLDNTGGGKGLVDVRATAETDGGWGEAFDKAAGLQVVNAGKSTTIDLSSAKSMQDVVNILNSSNTGLLAEINATKNGIDVRSRASGSDFAIGENGGKTAEQLGLRTFTNSTLLKDLNFGQGVQDWSNGDDVKASVTLQASSDNNDLLFRARNSGTEWNNFTVTLTNGGPAATPGITNYDKAGKSIDIQINDTTTAQDIVDLIAADSTWGIKNDWDISLPDDNGKSNDGSGFIALGSAKQTSGGASSNASIALQSVGDNNDLLFRANNSGPNWNGYTVTVTNGGAGATAGITYDQAGKKIDIQINDTTTAQDIVDLFTADTTSGIQNDWTLSLPNDSGKSNNGSGVLTLVSVKNTNGSAGGNASVTLPSVGNNNDLLFRANNAGANWDGFAVTVTNGGAGATAGITYDQAGKKINIQINDATTAQDIVNFFTADTTSGIQNDWTLLLPNDNGTSNNGSGLINPGNVTTNGGASGKASVALQSAGDDNDLLFRANNSGTNWDGFAITVTNGGPGATAGITYDKAGKKIDIQINDTTTAQDIVDLFTADTTSGIQDDWTLSLPDDGGKTNAGSGALAAGSSRTSGGDQPGSDFYITRADGVKMALDVAGAKTIGDVLDLINNNPDNADGGLVARLAQSGNGIELVDHSMGSGKLVVTCNPMSTAAIDLGLVPLGATASTPAQMLTGRDVHPLETESIFTALLRIEDGLRKNDSYEVQRSMALLDRKVTDMNFVQAELGAREQGLDAVKSRLTSENVELQGVLSDNYDANMEDVVTELTSRQLSYQASLKATGLIFSMTLLNYL